MKYILVEGKEGSGKSTTINALKDCMEIKQLKILDLRSLASDSIPSFENYDAIITGEPTHMPIGNAIRQSLLTNKHYSGKSLAMAFALDREVHIRKIIQNAKDKIIIQERGLPTTLCYQPLQDNISLDELMHLPGNRLAIENPPGLLIIAKGKETELKQNTIFDEIHFQRKLDERYESHWLKALFEKHGTRVVYLDTKDADSIASQTKVIFEEFDENKAQNNSQQIL